MAEFICQICGNSLETPEEIEMGIHENAWTMRHQLSYGVKKFHRMLKIYK